MRYVVISAKEYHTSGFNPTSDTTPTSSDFIWQNTGDGLTYENFYSVSPCSQPQDDEVNSKCIIPRAKLEWKWADHTCSNLYPVVCKTKLDISTAGEFITVYGIFCNMNIISYVDIFLVKY